MIILLSPAKTLSETPNTRAATTTPRMLEESGTLVKKLRRQSRAKLQELMHISEKLANLNHQRYQDYDLETVPAAATTAIDLFKGDVYVGLEADAFDADDLAFAQKHLRILSGLYGLLRPLDRTQPYRLEMGTSLAVGRKKNLYQFWDAQITDLISQDLEETGGTVVLNLASQEYFSAVQPQQLTQPVLNIHFKERRDGKLKVISFNAKKARGRMAHLIVKERITEAAALKELVVNDYIYNPSESTETDWVYIKA